VTFSPEQIAELQAPLLRDNVKERERAGRKFSYIEGWHAEAEANRIFGHASWDSETVYERCVAEQARKIGRAPNQRDGWAVSYICKVRITVTTPGGDKVVRDGVGAGHGIDADVGLAHESALKEAATDAEKRALKTFGNPFGLALYDKTQANVADAPAGVQTGTQLAEELASNLLKGCGTKEMLKDAWDKNEAGWKKVLDEASYLRVKGLCIHLAKQFAEPANQQEAA
jgi:recombination DNA repair RAD52 pathway protein